jgi:hypothetical protein
MLWDTVEETLDRDSEKVRDAEETPALDAEATRAVFREGYWLWRCEVRVALR